MGSSENNEICNTVRNSSANNSQLRIRATWLYYIEGLTQNEIAKKLGVNRILITRLLSEAMKKGEVITRIKSQLLPLILAQEQLEKKFDLNQVIVVPFEDEDGDPTNVIAFAAGSYISDIMNHQLTVGVGWGRTMHAMLPYLEGRLLKGVRIISLLGGIAQAKRFNPAEFAWQFAEKFEAEGFLIPAPAIVDSPQTRHALLEHCGLEQIFQLAESCEVALLSCGGISSLTTSYRTGHISESERLSLIEAGAVGDILYNFLNVDGTLVDHPINERSISISIDRLNRIPRKILISGGVEKTKVIVATLKCIKPNVFITDEKTANRLLSEEIITN